MITFADVSFNIGNNEQVKEGAFPLFDCSTDNIGLHLKNIFASGELEKDSVTEEISVTTSDGKIVKTDVVIGQKRFPK